MALREISIWKSIDWYTIGLYTVLVFIGWVSIYAASYNFDDASIFDFSERSGKQLLWIGLSFGIAFVLLMLDSRMYEALAYPIYIGFMILLVATIFLAPEIKGSRSWLVLGPVNIQPAEFAKFGTALALARLISSYNFVLTVPSNFFKACLLILLPMALIMMQKETGSALVYASLIFMLYREGMTGLILFAGLCSIVYFVVGVKYSGMLWGSTPVGEVLVLALIVLVIIGMIAYFYKDSVVVRNLLLLSASVSVICYLLSVLGMSFNWVYVILSLIFLSSLYIVFLYLQSRNTKLLLTLCFAIASVVFLFSVNYVFTDIMEPHQQIRIKVALGMEDDPRGAGYNVNQSKIAIGSGGLWGKGFLNGTQTKLKYVPEQDTDFIFCTIGEEEGFWGASLVVILFFALIIRIIQIAERQRSVFGRVYGYCVASILFFHLAINVGMVIGLCPVIGIPLPFFSYGGSSLWGFTILLFTLLRIDAGRLENY